MKIMIDTNIFISAALFPSGKVSAALLKTFDPPFEAVICDYILDELHRKFKEKFPDKTDALEEFLSSILRFIEIVQTPKTENLEESKIRDIKDRPILRAALSAAVDCILTGDKDFLESSVENPKIISVQEFLEF